MILNRATGRGALCTHHWFQRGMVDHDGRQMGGGVPRHRFNRDNLLEQVLRGICRDLGLGGEPERPTGDVLHEGGVHVAPQNRQ
jgi:hypothetical protein